MKPTTTGLDWRLLLIAAIAASVILAALFADPIAQDLRYHQFVDTRLFAATPNFMNVMSNLPSHTEALGRGDLRAYAVVQFLPMLLIPLVITLYRSRSDLSRYLWWMIAFYVVSKFAEFFDAELYNAGNLVSGHSLKHVVAALAPASLLYGLMRRKTK